MDGSDDEGSDGAQSSSHSARTRRWKREALGAGDLADRVRTVLDCMKTQKIDLAILLWAISWGTDKLVSDPKVRYQRTALMLSDDIPGILSAWETPPRRHGRGVRTQGGRKVMREFALGLVSRLVEKEVKEVARLVRRPPDEMSPETLLSIDWRDMIKETKDVALSEGVVRNQWATSCNESHS